MNIYQKISVWIFLSLAIISGMYFIVKTGETVMYNLFKKEMVIETIKETVKPEYLK